MEVHCSGEGGLPSDNRSEVQVSGVGGIVVMTAPLIYHHYIIDDHFLMFDSVIFRDARIKSVGVVHISIYICSSNIRD